MGKSPNPGPLAERSWPGSPLDADALSDPAFSLVGGAEAPELEVDDDGLVVDDEAGLLVDAVPALLALVEAEDEDGLELEFVWIATDVATLSGSLGLLRTEYDTPLSGSLNSREQAHAPSYQFDISVDVKMADNWVWTVEVEGKDDFYLSSSHSTRSQAYQLVNTNVTYDGGAWTVAFWARNLFDETTIIRGFRFGNDPRKFYEADSYFQFGEPRVLGLSASYRFF